MRNGTEEPRYRLSLWNNQLLQGMGLALLLVGASFCIGLYFLDELWNQGCLYSEPANDADLPPGGVSSQLPAPAPPTPSSTSSPSTSSASAPSSSSPQLAQELWNGLYLRIAKLEEKYDWEGVPACVRHHLRSFLVTHLIMADPIDPTVQRPPPKPEGWTGSSFGYGTNRIYVVAYNKFKERQHKLNETLSKYNLTGANMVEWWEAPYLDVPSITNNTDMIKCFWPNRREGNAMSKKEISLWLKHITIYYHALLFGLAPITVLEDDALVRADTVNVWPVAFRELPANWALLWPGSCINIHGKVTHGRHLAKRTKGRCGHGYVISSIGIMTAFKGVSKGDNRPLDHHHNLMCEQYPIDCYWMEPHVIDQEPSEKHTETEALGNSRSKFDKR